MLSGGVSIIMQPSVSRSLVFWIALLATAGRVTFFLYQALFGLWQKMSTALEILIHRLVFVYKKMIGHEFL
jgi:hypothetical protein